jgi:hypothetical protein
MDAPLVGYFWKNTFFWDADCPAPEYAHGLRFGIRDRSWIADALAQVMASSIDESEATRCFAGANCWRAFCDTSSLNVPMISSFRRAGHREKAPWQRPIA